MAQKTVLIVDDHPAIADSISMAIQDLDSAVNVRVANSMFQALAMLNETRSLEFCLLDLMLRDTRGEETLLSFRRAAPDVPVIVYTGLEIFASALARRHLFLKVRVAAYWAISSKNDYLANKME
jgi:DNA-binding NtrC family response regulator